MGLATGTAKNIQDRRGLSDGLGGWVERMSIPRGHDVHSQKCGKVQLTLDFFLGRANLLVGANGLLWLRLRRDRAKSSTITGIPNGYRGRMGRPAIASSPRPFGLPPISCLGGGNDEVYVSVCDNAIQN